MRGKIASVEKNDRGARRIFSATHTNKKFKERYSTSHREGAKELYSSTSEADMV